MENRADFVLELQNADGTPADEPDCRVEFLRLDQQVILKADHLQFPPSHRFTVPAFPQGRNLRCFISPFNSQAVQSEFFTLDDGETRTLPVAVYNMLSFEQVSWGPLAAAALVVTLPVLLLTLFAQRQIVAGLTAGAVK